MYDVSKPYKNKILEKISETWNTPYVSIKYPFVSTKVQKDIFVHADGIGSKALLHWKKRSFKEAVQDALAMNLNDIAVFSGTPYLLSCHLTLPEDDHEAILEIVSELAERCKEYQIAYVGGETSIDEVSSHFDISLTLTSFIDNIEKSNKIKEGDWLFGLCSSGLHSNGFTLARKHLEPDITPTVIYLEKVKQFSYCKLVHLAGGAYTRLKEVCEGTDLYINLPGDIPEIFYKLKDCGISPEEMYKTFNCGIGFIIATNKHLQDLEPVYLGRAVPGSGKIHIRSSLSKEVVVL